MTWVKTGKKVTPEGTDVTYCLLGTSLSVVSQKRHIPHSNGNSGTWDYTDYHLYSFGKEIRTFHRLQDAKDFAEELARELEADS